VTDTDNCKPAAQMTGRGQQKVSDVNGKRNEDDTREETDDDNTDKAANGEESDFEIEEDMKEETDTDDDDEKKDDEEETDDDEEGVSTSDKVTIVKVVTPRKKGKKSPVTEVANAESTTKHQARKATVEEEKAALASFKNLKSLGTSNQRKPAPKASVGPWQNSMSLYDWDNARLNGPPPDTNLPPNVTRKYLHRVELKVTVRGSSAADIELCNAIVAMMIKMKEADTNL
jgi:hypothetical protein